MLHYGGLDERINAGIPAFEVALKAGGKTYELFIYDGVNHAFNNDTSEARFKKAAADLTWDKCGAILGGKAKERVRHLLWQDTPHLACHLKCSCALLACLKYQ